MEDPVTSYIDSFLGNLSVNEFWRSVYRYMFKFSGETSLSMNGIGPSSSPKQSCRCKGKERKSIYIAPFNILCICQSAQAWITVLPANTPCLPFLCKRSPNGVTPNWVTDIQFQLTTHLSTQKGWKAELAWLIRFTHITGHPSATGLVQDRESSPAKDRRSTAVPCNQPMYTVATRIQKKHIHLGVLL